MLFIAQMLCNKEILKSQNLLVMYKNGRFDVAKRVSGQVTT